MKKWIYILGLLVLSGYYSCMPDRYEYQEMPMANMEDVGQMKLCLSHFQLLADGKAEIEFTPMLTTKDSFEVADSRIDYSQVEFRTLSGEVLPQAYSTANQALIGKEISVYAVIKETGLLSDTVSFTVTDPSPIDACAEVTIPVIFHLIQSEADITSYGGEIPMERMHLLLEKINNTFSGAVSNNATGVDTKIRFEPALYDPYGTKLNEPGINRISIDDSLVKYVEVDGEEFLYYKLPKITVALIKGTAADRKGNISFDDMFMSGDALSICQAVKANHGKVIVQVDRLVNTPSRPRNAIIPGCLVDAIVVAEPEEQNEAYKALTGSFEIPYEDWSMWNEKIDTVSSKQSKNSVVGNIIGRRAAKELRVDDIVNIGIGIPEMVSRHTRKNGMLDMVTLTVESGGIGGFPVSGEVFGAMIGASSVYDMANQFDLYDNGGLDICFMGALEVDKEGNVNAHRGTGAFAGIGGFANITAKTPTVVFCMTFNTKGLEVSQKKGVVTIHQDGSVPKFVDHVRSISFSAKRAIANGQKVLYVTERCVFRLTPKGLKLIEVYPGVDMEQDILAQLPFEIEI